MTQEHLQLPATVVGHAHLAQLIRELEVIENELESQKARATAGVEAKLPRLSPALADFIELNQVDVMSGKVRMQLKRQLSLLKDKAPVMHFTFATEPDPVSLRQLTEWVRREIHPQALLRIGLQPTLVAGTYLRTPNHVHDFSLRSRLHGMRDVIAKQLEELYGR